MADEAAERVIGQVREVAKWWGGDAAAEEGQQEREGDWHAQAAAASRRQADDWHALGDLLYAVAYPRNALGLPHLTKAVERLADRMDPDWRRVRPASGEGSGWLT